MRARLERFSDADTSVRGLYVKFVFYLVLSLLLTTAGAYASSLLHIKPTKGLMWGYLIGSIALVLLFRFTTGTLRKSFFVLFALGEGLILGLVVSGLSTSLIYGGLLATTLIVSAFSVAGLYCKNLSFLGSILVGLLFALLGLTILSIFVHMPFLNYVGLALFSVFVMYDVNQFKVNALSGQCDSDDVLVYVMELYLDIINILVYVLRIMSDDD